MDFYRISSSTVIENDDMLIMCEDTPVLAFNIDDGKYLILDYDHLPFIMKNNIHQQQAVTSDLSVAEVQQLIKNRDKNKEIIISWLANRSLSVVYSKASQILDNIYFGHMDSKFERARISIAHNAVSVLDNYWVRPADRHIKWDSINIRNKRISDQVVQIELYKCPDASKCQYSKDILDSGTYNKVWERHGDSFNLYKLGKDNSNQPYIEVMVSDILKKTSADICEYELTEFDGHTASKCSIITDENLSILIGKDFIEYCKNNNLNPIERLVRIDRDGLYHMWIIDYLIANPFRGDYDWGVLYDPKTMQLLKIHPILDFNEAFDDRAMSDPNITYNFTGRSLRESAKSALKLCNFHILSDFNKDLFMNYRQFICFTTRATDLGLINSEVEWNK